MSELVSPDLHMRLAGPNLKSAEASPTPGWRLWGRGDANKKTPEATGLLGWASRSRPSYLGMCRDSISPCAFHHSLVKRATEAIEDDTQLKK